MKKEELEQLRCWCANTAAAINILSSVKKEAPESIELIREYPADKEVHVFSGIEKISEALGQPIHSVARSEFSEKRVTYDGVTFFTVDFYTKR